MTDTDGLIGAVGGLLTIAIAANVAGKLLGKSKDKSLFDLDNHKTKGGKSEWW